MRLLSLSGLGLAKVLRIPSKLLLLHSLELLLPLEELLLWYSCWLLGSKSLFGRKLGLWLLTKLRLVEQRVLGLQKSLLGLLE